MSALAKAPAIYVDPESTNARRIFERGRFRVVGEPGEADLLWFRHKGDCEDLLATLKPFQLVNHLPNEYALADKGRLAETLYAYDRTQTKHELRIADLVQETYRLYDPAERARFFDARPAVPSKDDLWILKQCNSSEGFGIHVLWQFDELREFYERASSPAPGEVYARYVIQRYIENPLLLRGRKSEMRIYWLVASLDPLLVLLYREGTVRLNTLPFRLDDFDNKLIHVTNVVQQETHPDHDPSAVLKWSFAEWERYLVEDLAIAPKGYVTEHLRPQLRRMLSYVIDAAAPALRIARPEQGLCFALYGADVILDDTLHPWLSEVQEGPGLSFDDAIKRDVIPPMLVEAAEIMLEIARRKREGSSLESLDAVHRFEWVVNEASGCSSS